MRLSELLEAERFEINWEKEIQDDVTVANTGEVHPDFMGINQARAAVDAQNFYNGPAGQNQSTAIKMALQKQGLPKSGNATGKARKTTKVSTPAQSRQSQAQPARDRVKPTITTPNADRTRKDALGRNLKADRYYNQLNKTPKGRDILKRVSQKLGLPPGSEEVIDYVADTMPTVIQKLDNILTNPANIGGRLNPRNRRK